MMRRICQYLSIGELSLGTEELRKQLQVRDGQGQAGETQARRKGARKWRAALQGLEPGRG